MTPPAVPLTPDQLRAVLEYFRLARFAADLADLPALHDWPGDRSDLVRALVLASLLGYVRGKGRGTVYRLTQPGDHLLTSLT